MKEIFLKTALAFLPFAALQAETVQISKDPVEAMLLGPTLAFYHAKNFAESRGYRYMKIVSFQFDGDDHQLSGQCKRESSEGHLFELKERDASIALLCFDEKPDDPYVIDLKKSKKPSIKMSKKVKKLFKK